MVLQRLQLTNFRGFESLDLTFERDLTVLVGVNGCGKTSILDALRESLGRDQRGTCCYCYGPTELHSRIEHIEARTEINIFEWENLALACSGAEDLDPSDYHCDKR